MKSKKKNKSYIEKRNNVLSDARIYYAIALIIIFIWVPLDWIRGNRQSFYSYDWIWQTDSVYPINLIYLGFEFIIITTVFLLFRKK